jgi:hypothetical protein
MNNEEKPQNADELYYYTFSDIENFNKRTDVRLIRLSPDSYLSEN